VSTLSLFQARKIIEALRKGSVPSEQIAHFNVGRARWLKVIEDDLSSYIGEGGSKVRFICGNYGDGKTHFMNLIQRLAFDQGFAVAFITLNRDLSIHKFEQVLQALLQTLSVPGGAQGFSAIVEEWVQREQESWLVPLKRSKKKKLERPLDEERLELLRTQLKEVSNLDINLSNALLSQIRLQLSPLAEGESAASRDRQRDILSRWMQGGRLLKRDLKGFQIFENLNKSNSRRFLNSVIAALRYMGHKGLICLFDELEMLFTMRANARNGAYENVRLLIDNADHSGYLHIFFSTIPDMLSHDKGFKAYDALWSRVRSLGNQRRLNYRGVLIDLHRTPLKKEEFLELGRRLISLHQQAFQWEDQEQDDGIIRQVLREQEQMGLLSEVRLFIRQLVRALDIIEQGEDLSEGGLDAQLLESKDDLDRERQSLEATSWDS